ncbi:hypothetical protein [Paenarthrobacter sp. NPDC018779]|uniref:hypothetical protein n=1 Tax=Paenarthrobacter sp. NPDC018779 TaxID=3364375 RepID=UPI0037C547D2
MRTVTINFTGGKSYSVNMPEDSAKRFIEALKVEGYGSTHLTGDDGLSVLINRQQVTFVEVA